MWNERLGDTIDELLSPDAIGHMEVGEVPGVEAFRKVRDQFLSAFPDLKFELGPDRRASPRSGRGSTIHVEHGGTATIPSILHEMKKSHDVAGGLAGLRRPTEFGKKAFG